jgi:DNA-binding transcriptional LysR family regulator
MSNFKQLPRLLVFAEVANRGSFTRAAEALGISKSAVSQQIRALESELQVQLLSRTTRGVSTTALGQQLIHRCQSLQEQVDLIFGDISSAGASPKGKMTVTFPHAIEANVILPAIEQLCIEYPGIEPQLLANDGYMDLTQNNIDLAIRAGDLADSTYRALPIGSCTEIFCATPLYINRHGGADSIAALQRHRWIAAAWQSNPASIRDKATGASQKIELNRCAQASTLPSAVEMMLRHMGIALLPDNTAKPLIDSGEVVQIATDVTGPLWPFYTLHNYQQEKPIHITRFHQLVCRFFNS